MSINAKPGTKVFYCFPKNGNSWDFEKLRQLKLNKEYTVEAIQAHSFNTDIWLKEFPGVCFNHVNFGILIN